MNFDLSEITELVKNQNKTLDTFLLHIMYRKMNRSPDLRLIPWLDYTCIHGVYTNTCFLSDSFIYQMLALF